MKLGGENLHHGESRYQNAIAKDQQTVDPLCFTFEYLGSYLLIEKVFMDRILEIYKRLRIIA
jgi:hypothetical protein